MSVAAYDERGMSPARLAGPARAAVLLLAMGPAGAGRLLKHLSPEEIRALRRSAAGQTPVSPLELDELVSEFQEAFKSGPGITALDREMRKLLEVSLTSEELTAVLQDEEGPAVDPALSVWEAFVQTGAEAMRASLAMEHPQFVALVLTKLPAESAALVAAGFEAPLRNDVLRRMLLVKPLQPAIEALVETTMREVLLSDRERASRSARHVGLAEIVNRMDKREADELLATIAETKPEEAEVVRRLLFSFEDIVALSARSRLVLFDDVSADLVTTALAGAEGELREAVLSSLAARARRMVEAELAQPRELDATAVVSARRAIAALALRLAGEGRIALPDAA
ncbi:FliG C-terminal domain-containing protein [Aureimonas mangrovi]|uniref:FliG C-terminal domain-containing protein n=1 Tax=Aureimonas mangrovi TaxID=2758041 RepID=UPI001AEE0F34|nr:FliG C-terminal domain-containing protein [Aureimonas mangrovi]